MFSQEIAILHCQPIVTVSTQACVNSPLMSHKQQSVWTPFPIKFTRNWHTRGLWLSTAFIFSCKNTCRGGQCLVNVAVVLCSFKMQLFSRRWLNTSSLSRLVHDRHFPCRAETGVALACTLIVYVSPRSRPLALKTCKRWWDLRRSSS